MHDKDSLAKMYQRDVEALFRCRFCQYIETERSLWKRAQEEVATYYCEATLRAISQGKEPIRFTFELTTDHPPEDVPGGVTLAAEVNNKARTIKKRTVGLSDEEILRIAEANVRDYYDRKLTETPEPIRSWICPDPYRTREDEELAVKQIAVPSANEDLLEKRSVEEKEEESDPTGDEEEEIADDGFLRDIEAMFLHYGEKHGKYNEENWNRAKEWVREINWKISIAAKANREGKDPKKAISDALPPVGPEKETEH